MRIRKSASRLLGSAYSVPQAPASDAAQPFKPLTLSPMPFLAPCSAPESLVGGSITSTDTAFVEICELSRSPWDLMTKLSLFDPQEEEDPVDKYFVDIPSCLFTASMPVTSAKEKQAVGTGIVHGDSTSQPRHDPPKKVPKKLDVSKEKENKPKKKAKMKKEEQHEVKQLTYKCKKNDGKRWHCHRPVSHPNSLCEYHFNQKRAYLNPEFAALASSEVNAQAEMEVRQPAPASKPAKSTSLKSRKKKKPRHDFGATEGFYYYAGFGPFRNKRQCRSSGMNEFVPSVLPQKQEEQYESTEDGSTQQAPAAGAGPGNKGAAHDDASSYDGIAGIAGGDEESSDGCNGFGVSGRSTNGNGEHRDGKRKKGWSMRWRKPVKARSLKSLM